MDDHEFDVLTRAIARGTSRRQVLKGLFGALFAGGALAGAEPSGAAFICRDGGVLCAIDAQCCTGSCVDNHCTCPDGQILCPDRCIPACTALDACHIAGDCDPATGTCSNPVAADNIGCGQGLVCCSGVCTDVTTTSNCGACGNACPQGQLCTASGPGSSFTCTMPTTTTTTAPTTTTTTTTSSPTTTTTTTTTAHPTTTTTAGPTTTTTTTAGCLPAGSTCGADSQCCSGACLGGTCCNSECSGLGTACGATGCDATGACNYPSGTNCSVASCTGDTFTPASTCDGQGDCTPGTRKSCVPYVCNADGTACRTTCGANGHCAPGSFCACPGEGHYCPGPDGTGLGTCCTPQPTSTTCSGKCGDVKDNCGFDVDCGSCPSGEVCYYSTCCTPQPDSETCSGPCGEIYNNCGQVVQCNCGPQEFCAGSQCLGCTDLGEDCTAPYYRSACCQPETTFCEANSSSGSNLVCCHAAGDSCSDQGDCCGSEYCESGTCCNLSGDYGCTADNQCCGLLTCGNGRCCMELNNVCSVNSDCCSGNCILGTCLCSGDGGGCVFDSDCCTGESCCNGTCVDLDLDPNNCGSCGYSCGKDCFGNQVLCCAGVVGQTCCAHC